MIETGRLVEWLSRLVQIPAVGPANAGPRAGVPGELRLANQLTDWFRDYGAVVEQEEVFPRRPNVYGMWRGESDRWLAVDVHMDTVGVETMEGDPFDGRVADGRVYGRGSVDTRASLAIVLALMEQHHTSKGKLKDNVLICATADEETGCNGAPVFVNWVRRKGMDINQLIVAEPTLCVPMHGHKGALGVVLEIEGVAAHSAKPQLGKNAIDAAARVITALDAEHQHIISQPAATKLGTGSLSVTMIQGGQAQNIIPNYCRINVDRRLTVGEDPAEMRERIVDIARQAALLPISEQTLHGLRAFYQQPDTPWLKQLAEWTGSAPDVVPYTTNGSAYNGLAQESVIFGPGSIDQAHRDIEWVAISELEKAARLYEQWWGLAD
ncbi:MAG: M20/M25/M40 family metallo-hydrolase [Anaerolineae bacterium]